jgi:hypothetical protein
MLLALTVVSLFTSVVFAGQAYLFCSMVEREVTECCCSDDGPRSPEGDVRDLATCCHVNEHANPGSGTTPTSAHALDASPIAPAASPLAILGRADGVRIEIRLPDWNGPPLEERAKLQVFLL